MLSPKNDNLLDKKLKKKKKIKDHDRASGKKDTKQKEIQDTKIRQEKHEPKSSGEGDKVHRDAIREQTFNSGDDDNLDIKPPPASNKRSYHDRHGVQHYDQIQSGQQEIFASRNYHAKYSRDSYQELEPDKYREKRIKSDERRSDNISSDSSFKGHSRKYRYNMDETLYSSQSGDRNNKSYNTSKVSSRESNDWQELSAMPKSRKHYDVITDVKKSHSTSSSSDRGRKHRLSGKQPDDTSNKIQDKQLENLNDKERHHPHERHKHRKHKEKDVEIEIQESYNSSLKGSSNKTRTTSSDDLKDGLALAYDALILANKEKSRRSRRGRHQTPPGKSPLPPPEVHHGSDSQSTASERSRTDSYAAAVGTSPVTRDLRDDVTFDDVSDDERDSASPVVLVDRRDENRFAGLYAPPSDIAPKSRTEDVDKGRGKADDFYIEDNKNQPFYLSHEQRPKYAHPPPINDQDMKRGGDLSIGEMEIEPSTNTKPSNGQQNGSGPDLLVAAEETPPQPDITYYYPAYQGCRSVEEYQCLNRIEEGTYGVVYRAKNKKTNEIVALKRLKMEKEKEGFPITSLREINTLMKAHHKNVVSILEIVVGSNMDKIYIVMEFIEHDLKSLMETMKKPFLIGEVKTLLIQLIRGVHHLHDNWILHRDIKASNILLSHTGILKLGDFGLAREYGSPLKPYTPVVVTLWYRSPELLLGVKEYSTAVDMWSVGCLMGELLTLKPLFQGKSEVDQLNKIFKDLGTPSETIWPGYNDLPMVKKINFVTYPYNSIRKRLAGSYLSEAGFELLNKLLTYDPARRAPADEALAHEFFSESPLPVNPALLPTFPAKSEMYGHNLSKQSHSAAAGPCAPPSPKPPSGGKQYESVMKGEDFNYEDSIKVPTRAPLLPPQLHHIRQSKAQAYLFQSMSAIASSSSTSASIEISEKSVSGLFQGKPAPEHRPGPGFNLKF